MGDARHARGSHTSLYLDRQRAIPLARGFAPTASAQTLLSSSLARNDFGFPCIQPPNLGSASTFLPHGSHPTRHTTEAGLTRTYFDRFRSLYQGKSYNCAGELVDDLLAASAIGRDALLQPRASQDNFCPLLRRLLICDLLSPHMILTIDTFGYANRSKHRFWWPASAAALPVMVQSPM